MSSFEERDTILRLAKRIGEVLGRALSQLLRKQVDEAQATLAAGGTALWGVELEALRRQSGHPEALALVRRLVPRVDRSLLPGVYRATLNALPPA